MLADSSGLSENNSSIFYSANGASRAGSSMVNRLILLGSRVVCFGLMTPDTLIRDNIYQLSKCGNGEEKNEKAVYK
ncbi:MAG: hypothetical protein ACI9V8_000138 [Urechidicola sp.]|jgi:hypothetical protein